MAVGLARHVMSSPYVRRLSFSAAFQHQDTEVFSTQVEVIRQQHQLAPFDLGSSPREWM